MTNHTHPNPIIDTLLSHRVYRDFEAGFELPQDHVDTIIACAQQAPSWMNGQAYSIINITDKGLRDKIAALQPKNPQVATASVFLVIVADSYRASLCAAHHGLAAEQVATSENLITMVTDASMAAQNATIAAESLGYGTCPIGGIRLVMDEMMALLELPRYTLPIYGLCIGKPTAQMRIKPRLPKDAVYFDNSYQADGLADKLADYEQTMIAFGEAREKLGFREKIATYINKPVFLGVEKSANKQGLVSST